MIIKKELLKRQISGEYILVPVGKTVYDSHGLFVLNELGSFLWDLLPDAEGLDDLVAAVLREYEVSDDVARRDIKEFLDTLQRMEII